jgi:hypothetical protein
LKEKLKLKRKTDQYSNEDKFKEVHRKIDENYEQILKKIDEQETKNKIKFEEADRKLLIKPDKAYVIDKIDTCTDDLTENYKKFTIANIEKLEAKLSVTTDDIKTTLSTHKGALKKIKTKMQESTDFILRKMDSTIQSKVKKVEDELRAAIDTLSSSMN